MATKNKPIDKIVAPFRQLTKYEKSGSIILFISVVTALILANSPLKDLYHHFLENTLGFQFDGKTYLEHSILHWINDGLMAIFFFVVGLELKKEFVAGELAQPKKAMLPIVAAIGGMIGPATIYLIFNANPETHHGWGIPTATDIAFALGVLMFLGNKVPLSLKIFLLALAIVDDMGAVLVIALFYSSDVSLVNLSIGLTFFAIMLIGNKLGIRSALFYGIIGIGGVWSAFLLSGVHATIAAVLAAFTIPAEVILKEKEYIKEIQNKLKSFEQIDPDDQIPTLKENQLEILEEIQYDTSLAMTPLQKLINIFSPFTTFVVLPIFALANAGISLDFELETLFSTHIAIGVGLGLLLGKVIGVVGSTMLLVKLGIGKLPEGMTFKNLIGLGILASIGFTMSIFVASLAFDNPLYITQAKVGIFTASLIGGILGYVYLSAISKKTNNA
ncbi:MAG: Na+/H+ antiporter NhaA [Chitinophagales bacterium]|nr:Na+/H+ antiporter NhaA [Chitinophagales bacterium]